VFKEKGEDRRPRRGWRGRKESGEGSTVAGGVPVRQRGSTREWMWPNLVSQELAHKGGEGGVADGWGAC
jgi:hypothetical protein